MKIGDKIPIVLEIVREAEHGETIKDKDGNDFDLKNPFRNKFWAAPQGTKHPLILVCADQYVTDAGEIKRRAMVDLINCGVC